MIRALTQVHRWLGVAVCLLFAMWFATGIVMHFVPFPALTETERVSGLARIYPSKVERSAADAIAAGGISRDIRVRLFERVDGPIYVIAAGDKLLSLRADDLSNAQVQGDGLAVAIAKDHARRRGLDETRATFTELATYDQWTVPNGLDRHRPLYRISLNDGPGTMLYVSSVTGEVVRDTTRHERWWNYVGSVAHWIYPTILRAKPSVWHATVWLLSFVALIEAVFGAALGVLAIRIASRRFQTPYRGWLAVHHVMGLGCMVFVLSWIISGWLSMDNGQLFSTGKLSETEAAATTAPSAWDSLPALQGISTRATEIEWFALGDKLYRRDLIGLERQRLTSIQLGGRTTSSSHEFLEPSEINELVARLARPCEQAAVISAKDNYTITGTMPDAPVYRSICGDVWYHVDGASGVVLERLDQSGRLYRWLYGAAHTLDIPMLVAHPTLRSALIVVLCSCGFLFSFTAIVIGWRRIRSERTNRFANDPEASTL